MLPAPGPAREGGRGGGERGEGGGRIIEVLCCIVSK